MTETAPARQRIDKWLFFARIAKSRTLAQDWVEGGHVSVNGEKLRRSSAEVRPGDRLEVLVERRTYILVVKAPGERRGPYEEARLLYDDHSPPPERLTPFEQAQRAPGAGRPEKKDRRALDRLRNQTPSDGG
jgi:ribosome-associated heat shock protein Hsp15